MSRCMAGFGRRVSPQRHTDVFLMTHTDVFLMTYEEEKTMACGEAKVFSSLSYQEAIRRRRTAISC